MAKITLKLKDARLVTFDVDSDIVSEVYEKLFSQNDSISEKEAKGIVAVGNDTDAIINILKFRSEVLTPNMIKSLYNRFKNEERICKEIVRLKNVPAEVLERLKSHPNRLISECAIASLNLKNKI